MPGLSSERGEPSLHRLSLKEFPTAASRLRFAVRFPGPELPLAVRFPAGGGGDAVMPPVEHDAATPHPLAGTGKLFLAVAVARCAEWDPALLSAPVVIRREHGDRARSGTLRHLSGDLALTVEDATALIVATGDGACVLALLEVLDAAGLDPLEEARRMVAGLSLAATDLAGLEAGESWGEGLVGTTTPGDLCTLLEHLAAAEAGTGTAARPASAGIGAGDRAAGAPAPLDAREAARVLGWMGTAFEPAGLASSLPGFGPRTMAHRTVSGLELLAPPGAPGCASVLILPADVGTGRPAACVAAYQPHADGDGSAVSAREASRALGALGLAVATLPD